MRRSGRDRTAPVEFWRNEYVKYKRRDSLTTGAVFLDKVGVHQRPKPPVRHLGINGKTPAQQRAASARAKTKSASAAPASATNGKGRRARTNAAADEEEDGDGGDGEEAQGRPDWGIWDEETDPDGLVWDYVEGKEVKDRESKFRKKRLARFWRLEELPWTTLTSVKCVPVSQESHSRKP